MDFGFGSFLEAFEKYAGKFATRLLVLMMGLAVAVTCAGLIWSGAIEPLLQTILPLTRGVRFWTLIANVGFLAGGAVMGAAFGSWILTSFVRWKEARAYRNATKRLEAMIVEVRESHDDNMLQLEEMLVRASGLNQESSEMHDHFLEVVEGVIEVVDGGDIALTPEKQAHLDELKRLAKEMRDDPT